MKNNLKTLLLLHIILMGYSVSGIFTKVAAEQSFLSLKFIFCYGMVIVILGLYALLWQQVIKKMPLTTAFANKAVTVVWGIIWGVIFFHEEINIGKIIGAIVVIVGVILYVKADNEEESHKDIDDEEVEHE